MSQQEEEISKDLLEIFSYNSQKYKQNALNPYIIHIIWLKCIREKYIDVINITGDVFSYIIFEEIPM